MAAQKEWATSTHHGTTLDLLKSVSKGTVYDDVVVMSGDAAPSLTAKTVELVSWIYPVTMVDDDFEKKCRRVRVSQLIKKYTRLA